MEELSSSNFSTPVILKVVLPAAYYGHWMLLVFFYIFGTAR